MGRRLGLTLGLVAIAVVGVGIYSTMRGGTYQGRSEREWRALTYDHDTKTSLAAWDALTTFHSGSAEARLREGLADKDVRVISRCAKAVWRDDPAAAEGAMRRLLGEQPTPSLGIDVAADPTFASAAVAMGNRAPALRADLQSLVSKIAPATAPAVSQGSATNAAITSPDDYSRQRVEATIDAMK